MNKYKTIKHQCPACLFTHDYKHLEQNDEVICNKCAAINLVNEDESLRLITQKELDKLEPDHLMELINDQDEMAKKIRAKKKPDEYISEAHRQNAEAEKKKKTFTWQTVLKDPTRYKDVLELLIEIKRDNAFVSVQQYQSTLVFSSHDDAHLEILKAELLFHKLIKEL